MTPFMNAHAHNAIGLNQWEIQIWCETKLRIATKGPLWHLTAFLSRFGTFLRSKLKFSKLFKLHIIVSLLHIKKALSHCFEQVANVTFFGTSMQNYVQLSAVSYIINCLCNVMVIKMHYNGSLLNSLTPHYI